MNRAERQWLNDLADYEQLGGFIPDTIRAAMFFCFCANEWDLEVYGRMFNIHLNTFRDAADWIEANGPDMPKPAFGL